jgi:GNAT superfamily N-acetyltransferase
MHMLSKALPALALSLSSDPFYQAITVECRSPLQRQRVLESYFEYSLAEAQRTGHCALASDPTLGATAWLLPRRLEVEATESEAKHGFLQALLGPKGYQNYQDILSFMSPRAARHVENNAWYLSIVGVHPSAQGKGLGQQLLLPTLRLAAEQQAPCYLETFTPRNLAFYTRLGFQSAAEYLEPTTGASYTIMHRGA